MIATTVGITLRAIGPADDSLVARLFIESRPDLDLLPPDVRETLVPVQVRAQLAQWATDHPAARHDVICVDGTDVGRVVVAETETETHLVDLVVLRHHRRRGIATAVLARLLADADAQGRPVRLSVWPTNDAAIGLYRRHGFAVVPGDGMHVQMRREAPHEEGRP